MDRVIIKRMSLTIFALLLIFLVGCSKDLKVGEVVEGYTYVGDLALEQVQMPAEGEEIAVIITSKGIFKMRLFHDIAPMAVNNFTTLARDGYYDGMQFFTVLSQQNFIMVDDFKRPGNEKGTSVTGESYDPERDLYYRNITGAVGMTGYSDGSTIIYNNSTFYVIAQEGLEDETLENMHALGEEVFPKEVMEAYLALGGEPWIDIDRNNTIFGHVFYGLDVVREIIQIPINPYTHELEDDVIIESIEIVRYGGK